MTLSKGFWRTRNGLIAKLLEITNTGWEGYITLQETRSTVGTSWDFTGISDYANCLDLIEKVENEGIAIT